MFTTLYLLGLVICAIATALAVRADEKPKHVPVRIKRDALPPHLRRHQDAQDRGDFHR
ncbi:hypothetical protein OKA04_04585 [Luteolibacter flavescens]|uniref:Uncharacterized protein n=1 Tax=Luteolibacter flavescens TaxID=1859460 RepID=A0ABT3FKA6_9BACT|nr:hypothetical protein [Luteolibacter flavescens]MCW1883993.1 hypothetical protein [Luteolibacter flavescens]